MFDTTISEGDIVLLRGRATKGDVRLDDGQWVGTGSVVAAAPEIVGMPYPLVLFFETEGDRQEFIGNFLGAGCVAL